MYCRRSSSSSSARSAGGVLQHEPALGAGGDDHGVLDHLRLHQPQDLGAVVLQPVGPADAAAGDEAAAQVHTLHLGRVHEDLPARHRLGHPRHVLAAQLERHVGQRALVLEDVRADGGQDHAQEAAQDAVVVEAGDLVQTGHDLGLEPLGRGVAVTRRVEPVLEQRHQLRRQLPVAHEGVVHVALGEAAAQQLPVLAVGAQHRHLAPGQRRGRHQPVERVALGPAVPDRPHRVGHQLAHPVEVERPAVGAEHAEVVQVATASLELLEPGRHLLDHGQAQRLQHRQQVRQRRLAAGLVQLQPGQRLRRALLVLERDRVGAFGAQRLELVDVELGHADRRGGLVVVGEQPGVAAGQRVALQLSVAVHQRVGEGVVPGARRREHLALELVEGHVRDAALGHVHHEVEAGRIGLSQRQVVVDRLAVVALLEQVLQPQPQLRGDTVARQCHGRRDEPAQQVGAHEQLHLPLLLQPQQRHHGRTQVLGARREQLVLGEALEDADDGLVVVRAGEQVLRLHDVVELAADQRDLTGRLHQRLAGEQADEPQLAHQPAVLADLSHADVVHLHAAMHGGLAVGLGDDHQRAVQHPVAHAGRQLRQRHRLGELGALDLGEDAEPGAGHGLQRGAVTLARGRVLAVSEEHEVVGAQPVQQRHSLADLVLGVAGDRRPARTRPCGRCDRPSRGSRARTAARRASTRVTAWARSSSWSSGTRRSTSKCIIDSRCSAPRAGPTDRTPPSSVRSTPITGCTTWRTSRPRPRSASLTESIRNGASAVLASTTVPGVR